LHSKGSVTVEVANEWRSNLSVNYTLKVFDFALPSASSFATEFGFSVENALKQHFGPHYNWDKEAVPLTQLYLDAALMNKVTLGGFTEADHALDTRNTIDWKVRF